MLNNKHIGRFIVKIIFFKGIKFYYFRLNVKRWALPNISVKIVGRSGRVR